MEKYHGFERTAEKKEQRKTKTIRFDSGPSVPRSIAMKYNPTDYIHHKQPASEHVESMVENIRETKLEKSNRQKNH